MQLLGGNTDLSAEAELTTVDETTGGVDQHGRSIDLSDEPVC